MVLLEVTHVVRLADAVGELCALLTSQWPHRLGLFFHTPLEQIISYESDPEAMRAVIPAPLEPAPGNVVLYEWINMPDSTGFGSYSESGTVIPCIINGPNGPEPINFTLDMFLDCEVSAGARFGADNSMPSIRCLSLYQSGGMPLCAPLSVFSRLLLVVARSGASRRSLPIQSAR